MLLSAFFDGTLAGLGTLVFIGPVLFTLLNASLQGGWRLGFFVATGIFLSDIACVVVCLYAAIPLVEKVNNHVWLGCTGALILFLMGFKYFLKPSVYEAEACSLNHKTILSAMVQGFLVNFVNPFVFFVWIGIIAYAKGKVPSQAAIWPFLAGTLFAIYATDITKSAIAHKIRQILEPHMLSKISRGVGIILMASAIRMLWLTVLRE